MNSCSTRSRCIERPTTQVRERKGGGRRVGQDVEIEGCVLVEGPQWELVDERFAVDSWQMGPHASDQGGPENTQPEEVRQARPLAATIEIEHMPRILAMSVVERVVGVSLVVQRPDASALESRAEVELPLECALEIPCERPRRCTVRRQFDVEMIVRGAECKEASPVALRKDDASDDAKRGRGGRDRAVIFQSDRHVKSDRLAWLAAIEWGTMRTIVGRSIAKMR